MTQSGHWSLVSVGTVCFFDYARAARQAPLPGSLVTVTSPPIMRANLQVIASPPRLGRGVIIENQAGWRQELSGTIAQCLNLEQEIHHTASKLCILGVEPLK